MDNTRELVREAYERLGSVSAVAAELGKERSTIRFHLKKLGIHKPIARGKKEGMQETRAELPEKGVRRYILTCAQNNTWVWAPVWENLLALAAHYGAILQVSRFTYNKDAFNKRGTAKPGTQRKDEDDDLWYDPKIEPYINDSRVELAPGLVWCGEMNILPTAARPLTGFETYTGRKSGIFPHVKFAMESIASGKHEATKFNYTTGTVTQVNYIQKKAGLKAEHHHGYGALLVEVDSEGRWFVRQLNADRTGTIYDLDVKAEGGKITTGHAVEGINWGDIHADMLDEEVARLAWGPGGMAEVLRPRHQFMHDLVNFGRRNHHDRDDPHIRFQRWLDGQECVREEMQITAKFLARATTAGSKIVVVDSNHDNALLRWLRESDYRRDPVNAIFFLECQSEVYRAMAKRDHRFHLVEHVMRSLGCPEDILFLREDDSYILCKDKSGGIECGMHGHRGPNGTRGTPLALSKMGRRANTGHTHVAGIIDGLCTAGTSSMFDMKYNPGPSSWSHSHIVTYKNGKRAIITMWKGAWRAR